LADWQICDTVLVTVEVVSCSAAAIPAAVRRAPDTAAGLRS